MAKNENGTRKRSSSFTLMLKRLFVGGSGAEDLIIKGDSKENNNAKDDRYDSPGKQAVKRFFRKPLAVGACIVLVAMFLLVFIGPIFSPIDLSYTEPFHKNVAPTLSMMSMPDSMENGTLSVSSTGTFTVGVDSNGKLSVWGSFYTPYKEARRDVMQIPDEVKNAKIVVASAGTDHIVAIGDDGKVYAWGEYDNGQYGEDGRMADVSKYLQPKELIDGKLDMSKFSQLICGDQMTAVLLTDGTLYLWGNDMAKCRNAESIYKVIEEELTPAGDKIVKVAFTGNNIFAITEQGKFIVGNNGQFVKYNGNDTFEYIGTRRAVDIAATSDSIALLLDDSELMSFGKIFAGPQLGEGESIATLSAGTRHFSATTNNGKVYSWGNGALNQTDVPDELKEEGAADTVFASGFQNYAFKNGKLVEKWGHKGYLMGTDDLGRDVFNRVINGGKQTMTIGAVAVIVSSIIGIIVGCISGYFGGWVDLLLMRVTEIFAAIPFLPFALVLSAILQGSSLSEDIRIFIIMIILGLLSWTGLAKLVRGQILAEREKEFVTAARAMGIKEGRIAFKHILPNVVSVIIVSLTLDFATCMLTESSLSYLGFGVKLPRPTWGNMLDSCRDSNVIQNFSWRWIFPALFLAITVICINIIGDTLRDIFDPKSEVEK